MYGPCYSSSDVEARLKEQKWRSTFRFRTGATLETIEIQTDRVLLRQPIQPNSFLSPGLVSYLCVGRIPESPTSGAGALPALGPPVPCSWGRVCFEIRRCVGKHLSFGFMALPARSAASLLEQDSAGVPIPRLFSRGYGTCGFQVSIAVVVRGSRTAVQGTGPPARLSMFPALWILHEIRPSGDPGAPSSCFVLPCCRFEFALSHVRPVTHVGEAFLRNPSRSDNAASCVSTGSTYSDLFRRHSALPALMAWIVPVDVLPASATRNVAALVQSVVDAPL